MTTTTPVRPASELPWFTDEQNTLLGVTIDLARIGRYGYKRVCFLPWKSKRGKQNMAYIVHAANAYLKLVAAVRLYRESHNTCIAAEPQGLCNKCQVAEALLRQLGEI